MTVQQVTEHTTKVQNLKLEIFQSEWRSCHIVDVCKIHKDGTVYMQGRNFYVLLYSTK